MDKDESDEISKSFMQNLLKRDSKIVEKLGIAHREPDQIYKILKERLDLYTEASKHPLSDMYQLYISNIKTDIMIQATIAAAKDDFTKQVSQIISRLDVIENEIKNIKDKLSIN